MITKEKATHLSMGLLMPIETGSVMVTMKETAKQTGSAMVIVTVIEMGL
jgi:hypothetical protein